VFPANLCFDAVCYIYIYTAGDEEGGLMKDCWPSQLSEDAVEEDLGTIMNILQQAGNSGLVICCELVEHNILH
jgi:hypothetical protein